MALTRQTHVLDGLDRLAAAGIRAAKPGYRDGVMGPIREAIDAADNAEELLAALNGELFARMDTSDLEETLADGMAQAALIGRVASEPGRKPRRHEATQRRRGR